MHNFSNRRIRTRTYGGVGGAEPRGSPLSRSLTRMYGPAVRRKRFSSICRLSVLHQCIRPLIGAWAPGHHGYQRACVLISGPASSGPFGSPGFACAGKTVLHLVSSSRRPRQVNDFCAYVISGSCQFLCSCREAVPSSRPALVPGRPAQGAARLAVALGSPLASAFPGHVLTAPSTVPRSRRLGRHRTCPHTFEFALLVENRPGDASKLVGERDRQHIVVHPLFGGFDPRLQPVAS